MKKKNYGWVIEILPKSNIRSEKIKSRQFYSRKIEQYAGTLFSALVFTSRKEARNNRFEYEIVHKVSLTKTGKPKAIIGRG